MPKKGTDKYNFITKEQLEQLYIKANLSREEVAKKLGLNYTYNNVKIVE